MVTVRNSRRPHFTPPKYVEPVTASFPAGASPETPIVWGFAGSSLVTVIVAVFGPKLAGSNRIGTPSELPASIVSGYDRTSGTRNSPDEDEIPVTLSVHRPLLLRISDSSLNDPTQQLPKLPLSAMTSASRGGGATPVTGTWCGAAGSSLPIVIVPDLNPTLDGWKRTATWVDPPEATTIG